MKNIKVLFLIVVALGLADAVYLTYIHYANVPPYCPNTGIINCVKVTTSALSEIMGVPIAVLGLVWFALMGMLAVLGVNDAMTNIWSMIGAAAVVYSTTGMWLVKAICIWCTAMDVMIVLILALVVFKRDAIFKRG